MLFWGHSVKEATRGIDSSCDLWTRPSDRRLSNAPRSEERPGERRRTVWGGEEVLHSILLDSFVNGSSSTA